MKMKQSLRHTIVLASMGRSVMLLINLLLILIIVSVMIELIELFMTPRNDMREMMEMCKGIAIILYGYGTFLEVRGPFMKHVKLYPRFATPFRDWIDDLCHKYGIFLILLGLAQEVLVHLALIPNRLLNSVGEEMTVFAICVCIQVLVATLLIRLSYMLSRAKSLAAAVGAGIAGNEVNSYAE